MLKLNLDKINQCDFFARKNAHRLFIKLIDKIISLITERIVSFTFQAKP